MVLDEIIPNITDKYFAELELLKIDVASEFRDSADYKSLTPGSNMLHIV